MTVTLVDPLIALVVFWIVKPRFTRDEPVWRVVALYQPPPLAASAGETTASTASSDAAVQFGLMTAATMSYIPAASVKVESLRTGGVVPSDAVTVKTAGPQIVGDTFALSVISIVGPDARSW